MAIRLFGLRQPKDHHQDPTRLASSGKPAGNVKVVHSDVKKEPAIIDTVVEEGGGDPYNSTGRFLAEKLRQRRYD